MLGMKPMLPTRIGFFVVVAAGNAVNYHVPIKYCMYFVSDNVLEMDTYTDTAFRKILRHLWIIECLNNVFIHGSCIIRKQY